MYNYFLFVKVKGDNFIVVLVYVDDVLLIGNLFIEIIVIK